ncbi:hypothetical protein ACWGIV_15275, partial [Streptomyces sp. NPDC054844]
MFGIAAPQPATHGDDGVTKVGYEHLRRHGLRTPERVPRTTLTAEPDRRDPLTSVKGAGPHLVRKNDQGPVSDA